jgi:small-conductance mechanosensitive channel
MEGVLVANRAEMIRQEMEMIGDITLGPLQEASRTIMSYVPQILGALALLLIGWLVALLLRKVTGKALRAAGVDVIVQHTGILTTLERGGIRMRPSELLGWGIYWLILFSTLVATFNALGLEVASMLLHAIVLYIPRLLVALLLLGLGFFASRYIDTMVTAGATALDLPFPNVWGRAAQSLILFMAGIMVLSELGIATRVVTLSFMVLLAMGGLTAVLAFGLGGKEVAGQLTAGQCLRKLLAAGDVVQYGGYEGMVREIGYTHVSLVTEQGIVTIPNATFLNVTIIKRSPQPMGQVSANSLKAQHAVSS